MEAPAAAKPRTVAGPTKAAASALASSPDALTLPAMAATTGWVASCAASGTATDSAMIIGSQRFMIIAQRRAHQTMPALASTDKTKPTDRLRNGSSREQDHRGDAEVAQAGSAGPGSQRGQGDETHRGRPQHAGLGSAQADEGDHAEQPDHPQPPAADPHPATERQQEGQQQGQIRAGHRGQVGQSRVAEVIGECGSHRRRVTQHQGRHQRAGLAAPVRHRVPQALAYPLDEPQRRRRLAAPGAAPSAPGGSRPDPIRGRASPAAPRPRPRLPTGSRDHGSSAAPVITTSTGACSWLVSPRPATSTSVARSRTVRAPNCAAAGGVQIGPDHQLGRDGGLLAGQHRDRAGAQPVRERTAETGAGRRSGWPPPATAPSAGAPRALRPPRRRCRRPPRLAGVCQVPSQAAAQAAPASGTIRRSRSLTPGRAARSGRRSWVRCHPPPEAPRPG